ISSGDESTNTIIGRDAYFNFQGNIPTNLVNQTICQELEKLRKSRFFHGFDRITSSLRVGRRVAEGELSGGSDEVRGSALAWCARFLSRSEHLELAEGFWNLAQSLGDFPEAKIAEAFIISQKGDKSAALSTLASVDSDVSRSASLMTVAHHGTPEDALRWLDDTGHTIGEL